MKSYIKAFIQFQPQLHFQSQEDLKLLTVLTPLLALNIFRIFQEAVNNAIKYAKASNLFLKLSADNTGFEIILQDDGDGFDTTQVEGEHYGLQIMKHRATEAGLVFLLKSLPGKGTIISVSKKYSNNN